MPARTGTSRTHAQHRDRLTEQQSCKATHTMNHSNACMHRHTGAPMTSLSYWHTWLVMNYGADAISLMRDSNLRQKGQEYSIAVSIGDSGCTDYASCCLTKILHGIDSTRAPMSDWRMHPLFGKWRHCSFTSVRSCVEAIINESIS